MARKNNNIGCGGWVVLITGIILMAFFMAKDFDEPTDPEQEREGKEHAYMSVYCEKKVREQLKAPRSARFSSILNTQFACDDDPEKPSVRVCYARGWVDAQNSFGATLRKDWECIGTHVNFKWDDVVVRIDE